MRLAGFLVVALLGLAPAGRADVFVPSDPPAREAGCVAAAADVVAVLRRTHSDDRFELSEAGGPWRGLLRGHFDDCPDASAAADGTVAITEADLLFVRRGGRFAAPVRLRTRVADLAVAPGGWVAAVGSTADELVATVVAPDGTARTTRLGPALERTFLAVPRVGIDATGAVTVAWTRSELAGTDSVHAVRLVAGVVTRLSDVTNAHGAEVAVAPGGRTLLAWAREDGVAASIDGAPPERLGPPMQAVSLRAEIADDGSALIAYGVTDGLLTLDRAAGGPWRSHRIVTTQPLLDESGLDQVPQEFPSLVTALAPDGRAAVAWGGVEAAAGRAGGDWGPAMRQSAVTREADSPSLTLAPTGEPRLVWVEFAEGAPPRLRGARLAADAVADTVAPVLATRLPTRTPRTKTGRVTLRVPVTCSEACDAAVRLLDRRGSPIAESVRELAGGRRATMALSVKGFNAVRMLGERELRRPRVEVVVTDRVGNVARRRGTVVFRIVDIPLIEFRVGPNHDFAMFSKAGDRAVGRLVNSLITGLARGTIKSERELARRFDRGRDAIRRAHDEVDDTEVGDAIFEALYVPCKRKGYDPEYVVSG